MKLLKKSQLKLIVEDVIGKHNLIIYVLFMYLICMGMEIDHYYYQDNYGQKSLQ